MYEHWEGLIVQINGGNISKSITIGNIYRPPRTPNDNLIAYDIKNTWKVINECISKKQTHKKLPLFFIDNDTKITDKKDIVNIFNNYFTNIGQTITQGIKYKGSKNTIIEIKM